MSSRPRPRVIQRTPDIGIAVRLPRSDQVTPSTPPAPWRAVAVPRYSAGDGSERTILRSPHLGVRLQLQRLAPPASTPDICRLEPTWLYRDAGFFLPDGEGRERNDGDRRDYPDPASVEGGSPWSLLDAGARLDWEVGPTCHGLAWSGNPLPQWAALSALVSGRCESSQVSLQVTGMGSAVAAGPHLLIATAKRLAQPEDYWPLYVDLPSYLDPDDPDYAANPPLLLGEARVDPATVATPCELFSVTTQPSVPWVLTIAEGEHYQLDVVCRARHDPGPSGAYFDLRW